MSALTARWIMVLMLGACTAHATFTKRGGSCPKRPAGCSFELITGRPARDYAVIGVIDVEAFHVPALPNDEASFRAAITAEVCKAGGDAVVPGINGNGRYVLATVVKWVDGAAAGPACSADARPPADGAANASAIPDATAALGAQPDRIDAWRASRALAHGELAQLGAHAQAGGASW